MTTWLNLMAVAVGGAIGSVARHLITLISTGVPGGSSMPGTTIANMLGCAAINAFAKYSQTEAWVPDRMRLAAQVGFLGGRTTLSTLAHESAVLAGSDHQPLSGFYVSAILFIGWAALMAGTAIIKGWMT